MKLFSFMTPAFFCGAVSFLALLDVVRHGAKWWLALFYTSLPACFIIVGGLLYQMSRENARLRRRLTRLEQKLDHGRPGEARTVAAADDDD